MASPSKPLRITKKQRIQEELLAVQADNSDSLLLCSEIVEFARENESSALHGEFKWDLAEAAYESWISRARQLVRVYVEVLQPKSDPVRVWVSLLENRLQKGGGYKLATNVFVEVNQRAALLEQAWAELQRWRRKYAALQELAGIFAQIDDQANDNGTDGTPMVSSG